MNRAPRSLGLAVLVLAAGCGGEGSGAPEAELVRSVVLVAVDDLAQGDLACYGAERDPTPTLSALASEGRAVGDYSAGGQSGIGELAQLLSGGDPRVSNDLGRHRLPPGTPTLARGFRARGFRTRAAVSARRFTARLSGLDAGFDHYGDDDLPPSGAPRSAGATWAALGLADDAEAATAPEAPQFLFVQVGELLRREPPTEWGDLRERMAPFREALPGLPEALGEATPAALHALLARRRGGPVWSAWQGALRGERLAEVDRLLGELLARFDAAPDVVVVGTRLRAGDPQEPDRRPALVLRGAPAEPRWGEALVTRDVPALLLGPSAGDRDPSKPDGVTPGSAWELSGQLEGGIDLSVFAPRARDLRAVAAEGEPAPGTVRAGRLGLTLGTGRTAVITEPPAPWILFGLGRGGSPLDPGRLVFGGVPLCEGVVPRLAAERSPDWPSAEGGQPAPWGVDVRRRRGATLEVEVLGEGPAVLSLAGYPPKDEPLELDLPEGLERLSPGVLPDAALLVGEAPFTLGVRPGAGRRLALSVAVDGQPIPHEAMRWLGRTWQNDELLLYVAPWGLERPDHFAPEDPRIERARPRPSPTPRPTEDVLHLSRDYPTLSGPLNLTAEEIEFLRRFEEVR